jgi:hypothetical protein
MMMTPALRRFTYTTHITCSIGWIGACLAFLALGAIGFTSHDPLKVRGAYLLMAPAAWFVLVPLAHASLLSGIALSLGTTWGLLRYYWVVVKLGITVFATVILLIYMETFRQMAGVAADPVVDLAVVRNASPIVHAILAVVLLLTATVLGVYKPFGMTGRGKRKLAEQRRAAAPIPFSDAGTAAVLDTGSTPVWIYVAGAVAIGLALLVVILHLMGANVAHR